MELSRKIEIKYNWWNNTECNDSSVMQALEEEAERRIFEMQQEGFTGGELHYHEPENCIDFQGWFEINYV